MERVYSILLIVFITRHLRLYNSYQERKRKKTMADPTVVPSAEPREEAANVDRPEQQLSGTNQVTEVGAEEHQVQSDGDTSKPQGAVEGELKTVPDGTVVQLDSVMPPPEVRRPVNASRRVRTTNPSVGVDLLIGQSGLSAETSITVPALLKNSVSRTPDRAALCYKENGSWKQITYTEYYMQCVAAAKSFLKVVYMHSSKNC